MSNKDEDHEDPPKRRVPEILKEDFRPPQRAMLHIFGRYKHIQNTELDDGIESYAELKNEKMLRR